MVTDVGHRRQWSRPIFTATSGSTCPSTDAVDVGLDTAGMGGRLLGSPMMHDPRTSLPCGYGWPVWIWVARVDMGGPCGYVGGRVSAAGAGDESGHHGGEVPVEGSASAFVAHGGARVRVRGGFLYVSDPNHQHLIAPRADHRSIRTDDEPITTDPASGVRPPTEGCFRCRRRESDGLENHATSDRRNPSQLDRKRSQCVASRTAWWSTQARSRFTPRSLAVWSLIYRGILRRAVFSINGVQSGRLCALSTTSERHRPIRRPDRGVVETRR